MRQLAASTSCMPSRCASFACVYYFFLVRGKEAFFLVVLELFWLLQLS